MGRVGCLIQRDGSGMSRGRIGLRGGNGRGAKGVIFGCDEIMMVGSV